MVRGTAVLLWICAGPLAAAFVATPPAAGPAIAGRREPVAFSTMIPAEKTPPTTKGPNTRAAPKQSLFGALKESAYAAVDLLVARRRKLAPKRAKRRATEKKKRLTLTAFKADSLVPFDALFTTIEEKADATRAAVAKRVDEFRTTADSVVAFPSRVAAEIDAERKAALSKAEKTFRRARDTIKVTSNFARETVSTVRGLPESARRTTDEAERKWRETTVKVSRFPEDARKRINSATSKAQAFVDAAKRMPETVVAEVDAVKREVFDTVDRVKRFPTDAKREMEDAARRATDVVEGIRRVPSEIVLKIDATKAALDNARLSIVTFPARALDSYVETLAKATLAYRRVRAIPKETADRAREAYAALAVAAIFVATFPARVVAARDAAVDFSRAATRFVDDAVAVSRKIVTTTLIATAQMSVSSNKLPFAPTAASSGLDGDNDARRNATTNDGGPAPDDAR